MTPCTSENEKGSTKSFLSDSWGSGTIVEFVNQFPVTAIHNNSVQKSLSMIPRASWNAVAMVAVFCPTTSGRKVQNLDLCKVKQTRVNDKHICCFTPLPELLQTDTQSLQMKKKWHALITKNLSRHVQKHVTCDWWSWPKLWKMKEECSSHCVILALFAQFRFHQKHVLFCTMKNLKAQQNSTK